MWPFMTVRLCAWAHRNTVSSEGWKRAAGRPVTPRSHLECSLAPDPAPERPLPGAANAGLRVAWFGHAEGRRADGLSTYSRETVRGLRARVADVRFVSHRSDGDIAPAPGPAQLRALRFKTMTMPLPGNTAHIERVLDEFKPGVVHCSWSFSLLDGQIARMPHRPGPAAGATVYLAEPAH